MSELERNRNEKQSERPVGGEAHDAPAALPPSTNRGVGVSIHWLAITFFKGPSHSMKLVLKSFFGIELEDRMDWADHFYLKAHGARGYKAMWAGPDGTRLYGFPLSGEHCHLEIPGIALEMRCPEVVLGLLKDLMSFEYDWRITRIDIAFDDVPFTPYDCREAWEAGNVRTKAQRGSWGWHDSQEGATFNMGSRKSERMVRVYDRRGPTRLEMELKGGWADSAARMIAMSPITHWLWDCLGILRDFVDFQDGNQRPRKSDPELLSWWQSFVLEVQKAELRRPKKATENELQRLRAFMSKLLPSMYMIQVLDAVDFNTVLSDYVWKLSPAQKAKLDRLFALKDEE